MRNDDRGFALIAVLLVLALLGIVGAEFAYSMRLEASAMRSWRDNLAAAHLAEAGIEQAMRELAADFKYVSLADDGRLTFYTQDRLPIVRLPRTRSKGRLPPSIRAAWCFPRVQAGSAQATMPAAAIASISAGP